MAKIMANKGFSLLGIACLAVTAVVTLTVFTHAAEAGLVSLEVTDCQKCHMAEPAAIGAHGGKHKTEVTCLDCHQEHPPWGENVIPECSMCHEGRPHFELENCLSCHTNPHEPLVLHLTDDLKEPCLTCHEGPGQDFANYESAHAELSCTFCHETHGQIFECINCHEPHAEGQVTRNCLACHPAHHPLQISYTMTTPRAFCVPCHEEIGEQLEKTETRHRTFTCAFCHRSSHPSMAACRNCHGEPHSPIMHEKMPDCLTCHGDAHYLVK